LEIVAGAAMGINQRVDVLSGVLVPFGLRCCRIDPAMASSIFVTTLTDILGFLVFLGLAAFCALRVRPLTARVAH
jgi:magnesium transporter